MVTGRVDVEQFHRVLLRPQRAEIEGKASPDHSIGLKKNEVQFEGLIGRRAAVGDYKIGSAAVLLWLKLVQLNGKRAGLGLSLGHKGEEEHSCDPNDETDPAARRELLAEIHLDGPLSAPTAGRTRRAMLSVSYAFTEGNPNITSLPSAVLNDAQCPLWVISGRGSNGRAESEIRSKADVSSATGDLRYVPLAVVSPMTYRSGMAKSTKMPPSRK